MPCCGPTMPSDEFVNQVVEELFKFMNDKKYVISLDSPCLPKSFIESREKAVNQFRVAVKEILIQDACESW